MTEETAVEMLDYSKPPPGYRIDDVDATAGLAVSRHAWAHYKAEHDPPGMWTEYEADDPHFEPDGAGEQSFGVTLANGQRLTLDSDGSSGPDDGRDHARAAAWAWHDRRLALTAQLEAAGIDGVLMRVMERAGPWPRCLTWSDDQVAEVERWLRNSTEMPEVLRG